MPRTPMAMLSPSDQERLRALRRMKAVALGALVFMAVVFVFAFAFQQRFEGLAYVRAAAEGGMVGALADWFAVTALFRRPLGLPIPHTAIIPNRKDEIGRTLGEFVETNFLAADVVRTKLSSTRIALRAGEWLREAPHAERVGVEGALPYPPGVLCLVPGEVWGGAVLQYFLALEQGINLFPGFAPELQGVYIEEDEDGRQVAWANVLTHERETATLLVTHDLVHEHLLDSLITVVDGRIVGTPEPKLVEALQS